MLPYLQEFMKASGIHENGSPFYGQALTIRTDHKPLIGLLKKPLAHMSTRQQRFVARTMRYKFRLFHPPGKEIFIADFLSRLVDKTGSECKCKMLNTLIPLQEAFVSLLTTVQVSNELTDRVKTDAKVDSEYQATLTALTRDWPQSSKPQCGEYWADRDHLLVAEDHILFFQGRLVVPKAARARLTEALHQGHIGTKTMLKRAHDSIWWPSLTNDIKIRTQRCPDCHQFFPAQQREPMLSLIAGDLVTGYVLSQGQFRHRSDSSHAFWSYYPIRHMHMMIYWSHYHIRHTTSELECVE